MTPASASTPLADPTAPAFVGEFRPDHQPVPYYHDFEVRGGRPTGRPIYSGDGVDILDVSDPAGITLVHLTLDYPGAGAHNTCTTEDGQTVYVGDEIGARGHWMRIFDVSDLDDAELVGEIVVNRARPSVHNCYVRGDRLYVAHYTEGLRVFDVTEPQGARRGRVARHVPPAGLRHAGRLDGLPVLRLRQADRRRHADRSLGDDARPARRARLRAGSRRRATRLAEPSARALQRRLRPRSTRRRSACRWWTCSAARSSWRRTARSRRVRTRRDWRPAALPAGLYVARLAVDGRVQSGQTVTVVR